MLQADTTASAALDFDEVTVVRAGQVVWSQATFDVPAGHIAAVIGPNGSGKTTLLDVVLGLVPPASGAATVFGCRPGAANHSIGYVPQHYAEAVGQAIRARDAVMLGLRGHRWGFGRTSAAEHRSVDEALRWVGMADLAETRVAELSGGQRQRVAIAGALVSRPRMLLLDEPLASLDLHHQRELAELLGRLNTELGMTILVVAHDLNRLVGVLDGTIHLVDGQLRYAPITQAAEEGLLTHLYGTGISVARALQTESP